MSGNRGKPNVILIIVDTLRKDYARNLEGKLKESGFISYENAIAPAPWTIPSHASIFTGLYPLTHRSHGDKKTKVPHIKFRLKKQDNILTDMSRFGYESLLLSANPFVSKVFNVKGFTGYYEFFKSSSPLSPSREESFYVKGLIERYGNRILVAVKLFTNKKLKILVKSFIRILFYHRPLNIIYSMLTKWPIDKGVDKFIKLLGENILSGNSPKFIFINLMEVHEPYTLYNPIRQSFQKANLKPQLMEKLVKMNYIEKMKKGYQKEVEYATKKILEMLRVLKNKNLFDNSLIIVTSDHGQLLGENNKIGHGIFLYDELLKVPLLIKYPKEKKIKMVDLRENYISLTKLKPFILNFTENKIRDDAILYSDVAFAESYGTTHAITTSNEVEDKLLEETDRYKIAIYYKNFKGVFDVERWDFEDVLCYTTDEEVSKDISNYMKKQVIKFLNSAIGRINIKGVAR